MSQGEMWYIRGRCSRLEVVWIVSIKIMVIDGIPVSEEERAKAKLYFMDQTVSQGEVW